MPGLEKQRWLEWVAQDGRALAAALQLIAPAGIGNILRKYKNTSQHPYM